MRPIECLSRLLCLASLATSGGCADEPIAVEVPRDLSVYDAGAGLVVKTRPDGLQEVDLRGRFSHRIVARRSDAGLHRECATSRPR